MKYKTRVILIHGSYGNPNENWFPWLATKLQTLGHQVLAPTFPTPHGQHLTAWRQVFLNEVGTINSNTILIGHSLGCGFILNLLEKSSFAAQATFLVAGFLGNLGLKDFDAINYSFVCHQLNWQAIRRNAGTVKVYASDNDPYVPLAKGHELAEHLAVNLTIIHNGGHINASAGFTTFPALLTDLIDLSPKSRQ
ncbi:MAG: serine hydrolase family protein [Candidatus Melainabacteria bacterium]|nr:serine hydrolase family protein [Candidatus Melainabacteria bacterium]